MSGLSIQALTPAGLRDVLDQLDQRGVVHHLEVGAVTSNALVLDLEAPGQYQSPGVHITLRSDGTWVAYTAEPI
jgi:hypothetical protein